ncbi:MBL fold metallo-hydrolase [Candidatus Pantoea soli]|uniref:MBL fold metallo-hydrolase n=1 Tax=Candidatus Pantoea soli TaxID=3098669 RepID=A0A518XBY4_9GAMM|nr:MBL fold metallo-hydrolase [Pantoea soli]QDY41685.1 MBL fold metallo-hydrolase [Pantoea soli]
MKPLYEDLWISTPEFPAEETANDLMMHGFMLRHPRGNLLIGRVEHPLDHEFLADAGGVIRHYLTHWHEAAAGTRIIQQRFSSALYCHSRSLGPVSLVTEPDETFSQQEVHFGDFHLLPTPGHTAGSSSYLYTSPFGRTYLFVGDTLTRDYHRWISVLGPESNPAELQQSLELYRTLRPDVVLMSTTRGHLSWEQVDLQTWLAALDEAEQSPLDLRPPALP